jgi:hypothetical protein
VLDRQRRLEGKVTGGILDPAVSMLDPQKTWLKLNTASPVRAVEFKHWCQRRLAYAEDDDQRRDSSNLATARRLTAVHDSFVIQHASRAFDRASFAYKVQVQRERPGRPASLGAIAVVEDEGQVCRVSLGRLMDLFLDEEYASVGPCEDTIPLCE